MTVYLVGAGPGDPGLLTVRGAEVLGRADVVVYDRLSVASLLRPLAPPDAQWISVGKGPGRASAAQEDINALLVERGRSGETVVRLKGGDPFVFARGGEEAAALDAAGVAFEIVPGISSAIAAPAYAGVPVTHRGLSTSFTVVTGHEDPWAATETDWEAVAQVGGTIVVLMGVATRAAIAERLMGGGLPGDTPVASVQWGTRPEQHTVRTTLAQLGAVPLESPAVIVVGAVAGLDLAWFDQRPLFGRRVVVTRARQQASQLVERLRQLGAEPVEVPTIREADPADGGAGLRAAAAGIGRFDWVVVTSARGVERLMGELRDARDLAGVQVAAIGPGTAEALRRFGVVADLVPPSSVGEALVEAFPAGSGVVLAPLAAGARDVVASGLRAKGWHVEVVEAYRTEPEVPDAAVLAAAASADAITFTSSSTVDSYLAAAGADRVPPIVVCMGPITAATARARGLDVTAVADPSSIDGLIDALVGALGAAGPDRG